ncbi:MAG: hypothetical protein HY080_15060 [Gammaproteobacteria bacterium]|nr:hypothetical protein [Gammaproteobacteria bacterium]
MVLRILSRLLLIMALLLGQEAALLHALTHLPGNSLGQLNPHNPQPTPDECDKCASFAHLHAVLTGQVFTPVVLYFRASSQNPEQFSAIRHTYTSYFARGPPSLV